MFHHAHFHALSCQHSVELRDDDDNHILQITSAVTEPKVYQVTLKRYSVRPETADPYSLCNLGLQGCSWGTRIYLAPENRAFVKILFQEEVDGEIYLRPLPMTPDPAGNYGWTIPRANARRGDRVLEKKVLFLRYYFPPPGGEPLVLPEICNLIVKAVRPRIDNRVKFVTESGGGADSHDSFPDESEPGGGETDQEPPPGP